LPRRVRRGDGRPGLDLPLALLVARFGGVRVGDRCIHHRTRVPEPSAPHVFRLAEGPNVIERARGPLEPLAPSPYASVIYSALEPAQRLVPSDRQTLDPVRQPSTGIDRRPEELAFLGPRATPGTPPEPSLRSSDRLGPGRILGRHPPGVNLAKSAVPQCFRLIRAGRGLHARIRKSAQSDKQTSTIVTGAAR
jgi:hypothetical protein